MCTHIRFAVSFFIDFLLFIRLMFSLCYPWQNRRDSCPYSAWAIFNKQKAWVGGSIYAPLKGNALGHQNVCYNFYLCIYFIHLKWSLPHLGKVRKYWHHFWPLLGQTPRIDFWGHKVKGCVYIYGDCSVLKRKLINRNNCIILQRRTENYCHNLV